MALTVNQANGDASLLLTFSPIPADDAGPLLFQEPFRVLLDPWLSGPSHRLHPSVSRRSLRHSAPISPLSNLPPIDVIVISSAESDHCHPTTLRELLRADRKTVVLAEPLAFKKICSWKHIDHKKIVSLPPWEDPKQTGRDAITRIDIPPPTPGGELGEITVAYLAAKRDSRNKHPSIGITYRPPPSRPQKFHRIGQTPPTTPKSPKTPRSGNATTLSPATIRPVLPLLPTPPSSPSLCSKRSTVSLTPHFRDRAVSVIYAPHGTSYPYIESFATSHLVAEAALPLTALLHPFNEIAGPRWNSRRSLRIQGLTAGVETASALGTKVWIRTHDGEKDFRGLFSRQPRTLKHSDEDVQRALDRNKKATSSTARLTKPTQALSLGIGEDITLTSEGIWESESVVDGHRLSQPALGKYGLGDVLANIASEPFTQVQKTDSRISHAPKISNGPKLS